MWRKNITEYKDILIGVEVELEFNSSTDPSEISVKSPYRYQLNNITDSSLRNGAEFVFNGGKTPLEAYNILNALTETIEEWKSCVPNFEVYTTDRCSVHVHLDSRMFTSKSIYNFVLKYLMFEEFLFLLVDPIRVKNNFCKPLINSEFTNNVIPYPTSDYLSKLSRFSEKYTALNVKPLTILGTLEFRHHHGSMDSIEICKWISTLLALREYLISVDFSQLQSDVINDTDTLISSILGDDYPEVSIFSLREALSNGYRTLSRILERGRLNDLPIQKGNIVDFKSGWYSKHIEEC